MSDNTQINASTSAGDTIATDDIGGIKHQQVKIEFGADGVATPIDLSNPLPVTAVVTSTPNPAVTAAGLGKRVNDVANDVDTGVAQLVKRVDTLVTVAQANGDYITPVAYSDGSLWVRVSNGASADSTADNYLKVAPIMESGLKKLAGVNATVKYAVIAASTSGNNTILAAVASKVFRILSLSVSSAGTVNFKFQTGAGGTDITGLTYCVANSGIVLPHNPDGWFQSGTVNTLLNLNLSAAIAVGGTISYIEV